MTKQHPLAQAGYVLAWLVLSILATVTAWQLHVTLLYLTTLLIQNPALRLPGWSMSTLVGVSKLSVLIWGSLWLIFVMYMEYQLRMAMREGRLWRQSIRYGIGLLVIYGVGYLLTL
ncbi:MAG: hypothetical protein KDE19_11070 [Caldilineaceae bacterium]|nr:hypothetical protein [Caldilineaceae bacterium]